MFEYNFKLVRVVDGDTVDIDIDLGFGVWLRKQRIRIMGIDTPESRTSDPEEKVYGLLAKDQVVKLLGDFEVYHTTAGRWCKMAEAMILDAYGVKYMGQSKDSIAEEHLRNRERLKERGIIT